MTISPKMKKILAVTGGVTLVGVCLVAMVKCSSNGSARDEAQSDLTAATERADSLQTALNDMTQNRNAWYEYAQARGDTIQMLRNDTVCADSIVVLNDSIGVLNDSINVLNRRLTDCRNGRRSAPRRTRPAAQRPVTPAQPVNAVPGNGAGVINNNNNNNNNIIVVPAPAATNVTVNGGNGNTVNVNNGTVNNYYAPAPAPANNGTVKISSSASVTTTYVVKVQRAKCK